MSDLATISAEGTITNLSAAYLLTCWRDGCRGRVDADDDLGLCPAHREELREPRA